MLDGRIDDAEQLTIDKSLELEEAYKSYTDTVAQALEDGAITDAEQNAINEAQVKVDIAKAALQSNIDDVQSIVNGITITTSANEIAIANADGRITAEEAARINAINAEQTARVSALEERMLVEAALDGKIDSVEASQLAALNNVDIAQTNYTNTVKQALIDGEISNAEQSAINEAQSLVNTAKANLETQIANLSKVEDISWQTEVQAVIDGSPAFIDGDKIVTNTALVNNLNALGGIQADTISANAILGNNIEGAIITGARINGAVIKASYLDLDGELEVLTNYHITQAMYSANPSLYTDAVLITADNEYRIPSLSTVREINATQNMSAGSWLYGKIMAYNVANAGHNVKAVKIKPTVLLTTSTEIFRFYFGIAAALNSNYVYSSTSGVMRCNIYVMGTSVPMVWNLTTINGSSGGDDSGASWAIVKSGQVSINGSTTFNNVAGSRSKPYGEASYTSSAGYASATKTINGIPITFTLSVVCGTGGIAGTAGTFDLRASIPSGTYEVNANFLDSHFLKFYCSQKATPKTTYAFQAKTSNAISINNMI